MNPCPPPIEALLTPEQKKLVADLRDRFNMADFSRVFHSTEVEGAIVNSLMAVCQHDEDMERMIHFAEQCVRWDPFYGLYFAYYVQLMTGKIGSLHHVLASSIFSDAQINTNDDMAFHSVEVAYHTFLSYRDQLGKDQLSASLKSTMDVIERHLLARLKLFYNFYLRWSKVFDPQKFNPLTENMYYYLTGRIISSEFPDLHFDHDNAEASLLKVIDQCDNDKSDFIYYRIVARRLLGNWYICEGLRDIAAGGTNFTRAIEQISIGLKEALDVGLKAEIGHLHRLIAFAFSLKGEWQEAANHFMQALNDEAGDPASYWRCLSACELASVLRRNFEFKFDLSQLSRDFSDPNKASLECYRRGRLEFDIHMASSSNLPISSAIKLQMFRCYTENAIEQARLMEEPQDLLEAIEANSPREIVHVVGEMQAAHDLHLSVDSTSDLGQLREVFHRQLSTVPNSFDEYLRSFSQQYKARHAYLERAMALGRRTFSFSLTSNKAVRQVMDMDLPETVFVFFNVGRISHCSIMNFDVSSLKNALAPFSESQLQSIQQAYVNMLAKISDQTPDEEKERLRKEAIDFLLASYEKSVCPVLEPVISELQDHHVKIFPRLQMNAVPFHALKVGNKRLIEYCDVSYNQNLRLFLNLHKENAGDVSTPPMIVYNQLETRGYLRGIIETVKNCYGSNPVVIQNPDWPELQLKIATSNANDVLFACHGNYDPKNPASSCLSLGSSTVSFSDIFSDLDLGRYRSVVLGACESGLVKSELADEYFGLPSAFLASGVRYVIGTLWKVPEFTTSILLSKYFELLSSGKFTVPHALNEAQRQLMIMSRDEILDWVQSNLSDSSAELKPLVEKLDSVPFDHPYYWAGFYISGDV